MNGPWTMFVGLLAFGGLFFLQRSLDIVFDFTDKRARVWRRPEERLHADNIAEHDHYGGGSVMVWGGISWDGLTDLCVLHCGTLTAQRCRDDILDVHVRPYADAIGDPFILMDNNARPHTAHAIQEYLEREGIERLDWPARSPDLKPFEHVLNSLQTAILARQVQPRSIEELDAMLVQEWDNMTQVSIRNLIGSMRRRCQAVIDRYGSHTRY